MPIYKDGNGVIQYTPIDMDKRWDDTGVIPYGSFALCHPSNVVKQIQFLVNPTTSAPGVLTVQADIAGDQTINLTSLAAGSSAFGIVQPDAGTSPTAETQGDTLILTSPDDILTITGDSTTDTINFTAGSALSSYLIGSGVYMFSGTNSDITGYESAPYLGVYTPGAIASVTNTVTTTDTLLEEFATDLGYPNITAIPVGLASFHYETQKSAGSNNYTTFVELYKRTSGGTETLIGISDLSSATALNTAQQVTVSLFLASITYLNATDRLVAKVYATMASSSASIILRWDGITNARMQIPMLSGGTNTGDVTLATFGSTPNSSGASLSGQILTLQPASDTQPGGVSTTTQSFLGSKTFLTHSVSNPTITLKEISLQTADLMAMKNSINTQVAAITVDGNFAAPTASGNDNGFQFYGDPDTGFNSNGSNSISCNIAGIEAWRVGVSNSAYFNFGGFFTSTASSFTINSIASNVPTMALRLVNSQSTDLLQLYTYSVGGGTEFANITKEGYLQFPNGAASTPSYSFFNSTTVGLYSSGANTLNVSTNSSERMRFLSGGHVNIGANFTDTNATLQVSTIGTGTVTQRLKAITSQTADLFQVVNTSNTPLVGITVSGNFYAGTNGIPTANTSHSFTSVSDSQATLGLKVRSSGTQTADLISIFNSADTEIAQLNVEAYWYLPAGLIGAPSYTFYNDTKYGMYHPSNETRLVSEEKYLGVTKDGNIRVICHENAEAIGDSNKQEIRSGENFAPTFSNLTDITISVESINWFRIGNEVTVSVYGKATTSSYNYSFEMDLPVSSDFTNDYKAGGIGVIQLPDKEESTFSICAEVTNNTVYCQGYDVNGGGLSDAKFNMHFTYTVEG